MFPSGPSFVIEFDFDVSATSDLVCSPARSSLIFVAPPMVWFGAAIGWDSGYILAGSLVLVSIADCVGSKDFSAFTQDTAISWDVDELYSTIFFSINGGNGA